MFSTHIKALTFDVGGTLITPWPSVGHIYAEVAADHGHAAVPAELLNQRFTAVWKKLKNFTHARQEWADLVDATFLGLINPPPSSAFFEELYERFAQPAAWRIFEEVIPTLGRLQSRGLRLGIISNWDERLRPLLRRLKLDSYFDAILISSEVGSPKPARVIFDEAACRLAAAPKTILHVGDSLLADIQGARSADFAAVWLDRKANSAGPGVIPSLRELLELVPR